MKNKILFIIPSLIGGGAEKTLINLLSIIDCDYYDITVCSILNKGVYINRLPKNVRLVTLFNSEILNKLLFKIHQKYNFIYPISYMLKSKFRNEYFDFGICFLDGIATELLMDDKMFNKKITWVHACYKSFNNFYKFYSNKKYKNRLIQYRYKKLDSIIFVSEDSKSEFIEIFGTYNDMRVIYNPISNKEILQKSEINNICSNFSSNVFKFIAVGNLSPVKNYNLLIESVKSLKDINPNFKVFVLGSGVLDSTLNKKVNELNLNSNIVFNGFYQNPYSIIKSCDAFIMTSISEALPTSMIEAMILSKPIITTNVSGCREIVMNGDYGIITNNTPEDISNKMALLMKDKNVYNHFKKKSEERAMAFSDEKFLNSFYNLLK